MNCFIAHIANGKAELRSDESWHCAKVLRKKAGDRILVIDGNGGSYQAILSVVHEKKCSADIASEITLQAQLPYYLHLAIAPTKQIDRIEWMLEKCVEIGIHEVSFFSSKNSERVNLKLERMVSIAESAVKQSLQARIPTLHALSDFSKVLERAANSNSFIAHCENTEKTEIRNINFKQKPLCVFVGPEGDFTKAEIDLAMSKGVKSLSLGQTRLRTETAGLYVCQAASLFSL